MLSCLSNVKRSEEKLRPTVPPQAVFASYCGDCSGSMENMKKASATGCYEWVKDITSDCINNSQEGNISVTFFDTNTYKRMENVDFKDVVISQKDADYWAKPRGMTKLYDTATMSVKTLHNQVLKYKEEHTKNGMVPIVMGLFALNTDGLDNKSVICNRGVLKKAIEDAKKDGVVCFFLAANMNAEIVGESFGFNTEHSLSMDSNECNADFAFRSCTQEMRRATSTGFTRAIPINLRQEACPSQFNNTF
tara:strand:+ start:638 stop:1384 length:747 start_codon:yes stop_codon:yes gene_type:complete